MAKQKDIFLELDTLNSTLWNEKKALSYARDQKSKKIVIDNIAKIMGQIKKLTAKFDEEIIFLKSFHLVK